MNIYKTFTWLTLLMVQWADLDMRHQVKINFCDFSSWFDHDFWSHIDLTKLYSLIIEKLVWGLNDTNYNVKWVTNLLELVQAIPLSFHYIFFAEEGHPMEWCDLLQYVFTCVGDPLGTSEFQWGIQKKSSGAIEMFLYAEPWKWHWPLLSFPLSPPLSLSPSHTVTEPSDILLSRLDHFITSNYFELLLV